MKLETESKNGSRAFGGFDPATDPHLREVLGDSYDFGAYVRLEQGKEIYMQAGGEGDGPYKLEYREGDAEHHFQAAGELRRADLLRAFSSYLAGDNRWRTEFTWQKLEMKKPKWKFW
jgi:hypothetical protein